MEQYNFDVVYKRTNSEKWMELDRKFGASDLLSFWEADMDFQSPKPVVDALVKRAAEGIYGYPHKPGSYNEAVRGWFSRRHGWQFPEEWMCYTPLLMTAVAIYIREATELGDGVILQTPIYYPFYDVVANTGRKVVRNPMKLVEGRYEMDFDDLEKKIKEGAKLLVLCNPHNPGGRVWTRTELERAGELCVKYGVRVIADEAHGDFTWGDNKYTPFASLSPAFAENAMTLLSPGKTFNVAGTQQAVILIGDGKMRTRFQKQTGILDIDRNNCFSMVAVEAAYRYGEDWFDQVRAYIEANMDFAAAFCQERIPGIKAAKPEGTYLIWMDCRGLGMTGKELNRFMVEEAKVGFGEGMWFGPEGEGFERCTAACPRTILKEGLERVAQAVNRPRQKTAGLSSGAK